MLIKYTTDKKPAEVGAALLITVPAHHFSIMQVHNLQESIEKKGIEFTQECLIFEVCQPLQAKKVLEQNMSISTTLPCRISVYREDGRTVLATLKPTSILAMFNTPQLTGSAKEIEDTISEIMQEAATS